MNTLKTFWNRTITLDPSLRLTADAAMKMFSSAERVYLFKD
jgi:hypothetical protein